MIGRIGPALVVEIVQQADDAPALLVLAELAGISPHRRLDGDHVFLEAFALGVFREQLPCVVAIHFSAPRGSIRAAKVPTANPKSESRNPKQIQNPKFE